MIRPSRNGWRLYLGSQEWLPRIVSAFGLAGEFTTDDQVIHWLDEWRRFGANCLRVVLSAGWNDGGDFHDTPDEQGAWGWPWGGTLWRQDRSALNEQLFSRLEWILDEAAARGIYIVLEITDGSMSLIDGRHGDGWWTRWDDGWAILAQRIGQIWQRHNNLIIGLGNEIRKFRPNDTDAIWFVQANIAQVLVDHGVDVLIGQTDGLGFPGDPPGPSYLDMPGNWIYALAPPRVRPFQVDIFWDYLNGDQSAKRTVRIAQADHRRKVLEVEKQVSLGWRSRYSGHPGIVMEPDRVGYGNGAPSAADVHRMAWASVLSGLGFCCHGQGTGRPIWGTGALDGGGDLGVELGLLDRMHVPPTTRASAPYWYEPTGRLTGGLGDGGYSALVIARPGGQEYPVGWNGRHEVRVWDLSNGLLVSGPTVLEAGVHPVSLGERDYVIQVRPAIEVGVG